MQSPSRDTTVKLEAALVRDAAEVLPENQTLTAFVREAVLRDIRRRKLRAAALLYRDVLEKNPDELDDLAAWEAAPLTTDPKPRRRKS